MQTDFINSINAKANEMNPVMKEADYENYLKMKFRFGIDENNLSDYQAAFLILLYEQSDALHTAIHSQIDKYFERNKEWDGVSESGIELPQNNSAKWKQLFEFTASEKKEGQLFQICFNGWEIENTLGNYETDYHQI